MGSAAQLSVVTPVSRPELLPIIAGSVPAEAEWVLVTDGPQPLSSDLRPHVVVEGPQTRHWGDAQRQLGLASATRPFVYFLDDDNVMLPMLAELVLPQLEASGRPGALFGLLFRHPGGFYIWPPPTRVERTQVDTAMFIGQTAAARAVGWPDLRGTQLEGQRCADFVFIRTFDEAHELLRLPAICGFHDGVAILREFAPDVWAALERGELVGDALLALVHRHMTQADAPPWWKGTAAASTAPAPDSGSVTTALLGLAGTTREGGSVPAQRAHFQMLVRRLAGDRPGQPVNVLEVGFNAGLGAAAFLAASPQAHVVSFDLAEHPYVAACAAYLRARFPERMHLVTGDSRATLPRFAAVSGARFDLLLIDGAHDEATFRSDIEHARALAAPGAVVIVDDLLPHTGYGAGVTSGWEALVREGVLTQPEIWRAAPGATTPRPDTGESPEGAERRWGIARFA